MNPYRTPSPPTRRNRGFALIVTVSLMVLLSLLAVGLLSLSTITLRGSSQAVAREVARNNARLALMLAIGDLQKVMGPDARISARALTLAKDSRLDVTIPAQSGKAWWVGAANSNPESGIDPIRPTGANNPPVVWLVSGLKSGAAPGEQISGGEPFERPVAMYGDKTINMGVVSGGEPINAGSVEIVDDEGKTTGGYAYFIDDNGMKAQLASSNPKLRNDEGPYGGGVVPTTYDLSILTGMEALEGAPMEDYNKLISLNDLPLISGDLQIAKEKRLGYTTRSLGVLSDVKEGRLKRDLTIAFENEQVFNAAFPKGRGSSFSSSYLTMDSEKLSQSPELLQNGYIHWEMFKDYYNIKKHISTLAGRSGGDYLDSIMISKSGIFNTGSNAFSRGQLGPHAIGNSAAVSPQHVQMPYGDYSVIGGNSKTEEYKHSPVIPILSRMQENAWVEVISPTVRNQPYKLKTNVQLWTAQYNPFNIGLNVVGDAPQFGPRIIHYPQVYFTIPEAGINRLSGFAGKRQSSVPHSVLLGAGRSHVCAFKNYGVKGNGDLDENLYDDQVKDLTLQSIYSETDLPSNLTQSVNLTVDFVMERNSMLHGANSNSSFANHEVAQTMWAPFAWDAINGQPGKRIVKDSVSPLELNENTMASFEFSLRTTLEGSGSLRPLVDANIRAMFCNTRWDSPLGVSLLAGYSPRNQGETDEQIFQMNTQDDPKGYTYWGGGNGPFGGHDRVILFDVPREDLVSLGQLQHANVGRFSYEPTYVVGNSYANPRIPLDSWKASISDTFSTAARGLEGKAIPGTFDLYDASYLVNEVLWDSYIFTTIPQVADNHSSLVEDLSPTESKFTALLEGDAILPNPRFIPYEPEGSTFSKEVLHMEGNATTGAYAHNAGHLLVDGLFNVNSTSVDAWEAFLSGTHELPYQVLNPDGRVSRFSSSGDVEGVRFPRVKSVLGKGMEKGALDENYWVGFRELSNEEVRELAEAIVEEIEKRGPFLSLGEFVNRELESGELGERGVLQAALDATVNNGLDGDFEAEANHPLVPANSTQGAGFPGQLLQGDILQALSPYMSVRSDTFTIRAYGESLNAASGEIQARAWCEATVQRYPDPVKDVSSSGSVLSELIEPSSRFGRSFRMVSFRWLSPKEI